MTLSLCWPASIPGRACSDAEPSAHTLCVDHPFIISYHHCFQTDGCLVFVLEYCGGGEFYQTAVRNPHPSAEARSYVFVQVQVRATRTVLHNDFPRS